MIRFFVPSLAGYAFLAPMASSAAFAGPEVEIRAPIGHPVLRNFIVPRCAADITAHPGHINPMIHNGQH